MSSLHLINNVSAQTWQQLQRALQVADSVVLLGDAVYLLQQLQHTAATITAPHPAATILSKHQSFALTDDLQARQIITGDNCTTERIDYDSWVQLCVDYDKTISWL